MNTMLRKVVAGAGVTAVLAMQFASFVSAAGLDGAAITAADDGTNFTVTSTGAFGTATTCTATVNGTDKACVRTDADVLTIANAGAIDDNTVYSISFITDDNVYASVVYNKGTANTVQVTARVAPILTLALANGSDGNQLVALGTLTPGTFAKDDIGLTYSTNAVNGLTVSMRSTGLKDVGIDREIGAQDIDATADAVQTAATDYYKLTSLAAGAVSFDTTDAYTDGSLPVAAANGADMRANQKVVNTTTVQAVTTSYVTVGARVAADTEAGSYSDILTFSATGRF